MHTVKGEALDVSLRGVRTAADVRQRVAVALGVQDRECVEVKLLRGTQEVGDEALVDNLDVENGLLAVLNHLVPEWYPRGKYMHEGREVLRITGADRGRHGFVAEFADGSTENVDMALYGQAIEEWSWRSVARNGTLSGHPPEKPSDSKGWYSAFPAETVRTGAVRSAGAITGFLAGCTPDANAAPVYGEGNFATSFQVGYVAGVTAWGVAHVARVVGHFCHFCK